MKLLGLIGGTSWHSTIEYYRYLNEMVEARMGHPPINPPLLLRSLNVDLMRRNNWDEIRQVYLEVSLTLQAAGADALLICANTPHKVCPAVAPHLSIPFLHIGDAIGAEAKRLGLDKLGLLGTSPTMEEGFMKDHLWEHHRIQTLLPNPQARKQLHKLIAEELTQGMFKEAAREFVLEQIDRLQQQGAEGVILGCTELPMLVKPDMHELPQLNTTRLHAQMAVEMILD